MKDSPGQNICHATKPVLNILRRLKLYQIYLLTIMLGN
jgi:hypothetical protein